MNKFLKSGSQEWVLQLRPERAARTKTQGLVGRATKDKSLGLVGRAKEVEDCFDGVEGFQGHFYK